MKSLDQFRYHLHEKLLLVHQLFEHMKGHSSYNHRLPSTYPHNCMTLGIQHFLSVFQDCGKA